MNQSSYLLLPDFPLSSNNLVKVVFRDHSDRLIRCFGEMCRNLQFDFNMNDINADILKFDKIINDLYRKCFPKRIKFVSSKRLAKPSLLLSYDST